MSNGVYIPLGLGGRVIMTDDDTNTVYYGGDDGYGIMSDMPSCSKDRGGHEWLTTHNDDDVGSRYVTSHCLHCHVTCVADITIEEEVK